MSKLRSVPTMSGSKDLISFDSWKDVLDYARTGAPLYYQGPMDYRATRLYRFTVRARTIRVWPPGSTGRGRMRTSDPFTADAGHADRFLKPALRGIDSLL